MFGVEIVLQNFPFLQKNSSPKIIRILITVAENHALLISEIKKLSNFSRSVQFIHTFVIIYVTSCCHGNYNSPRNEFQLLHSCHILQQNIKGCTASDKMRVVYGV